jgi:catechol 2,3-dioxygenase-like lactoylglutathione lyase family enzyme
MLRVRDLDEALDFFCGKLGRKEVSGEARFFGHLAFEVDDIYARLMKGGVTINRPPRRQHGVCALAGQTLN